MVSIFGPTMRHNQYDKVRIKLRKGVNNFDMGKDKR